MVKLVYVNVTTESLGAVSKYNIAFIILISREIVSEIILDLSPKYYPYTLTAYPPTCAFYKNVDNLEKTGKELIASTCVVYGKSAWRITPAEAHNLEQGVIYNITID